MTLLKKRRSPYLDVFIVALFIALSFILPYMLIDSGLFLFFGDFDVQQVPFYMLAHEAVRSGNIFWSWTTDLGSAFIPSYSFYLLGSPFFWLTIPFPDSWVPYLIGPLLAIKIACCAVTGFAFIKRFVKTMELAVLGGLLYAFSSFTIYNIFFNHFTDVMVFFPLLLVALEEYMQNDRKGVFAMAVFICAFVNYNFFFGEVVFTIIYWCLRMMSGEWKLTPKKFALLAFEAVLGVGISCVLLIPSIIAITGNYRIGEILTGWNLLIYDTTQRPVDILHSLFFPQDLPSRPNFLPNANNKWASIAAWLPLFSLSGALAFCLAKRGHWLKRILCISLIMAMIPGLNALFYMLNSEYYARWFYMPVLLLSLSTVIALEDQDIDFKPGLFWTAVITAAFAAGIGLLPSTNSSGNLVIGLENYQDRFWVYVFLAIGGLMLVWWLLCRYEKGSVAFANAATVVFTVIVCIYGNYFIATGKMYGYDGSWIKDTCIEGGSKLTLDESSFFRVDILYYGSGNYPESMDNQAMYWGLPTIQAFQSTVSSSILEFYDSLGITRDVASRPDMEYTGLRALLSVKYLFDGVKGSSVSEPGWDYYSTQLGFKIWENSNYIPMGFAYDYYIYSSDFNISSSKDRILLKALVLSSSQISRYSDIISELPASMKADVSNLALATDAAERRAKSCSSFNYDNTGFTSTISLDKASLVFFSVPYDSGWTATVNGEPVTVEKVDNGMMAVEVPAGTNNLIRFNYMTPGLMTGLLITMLCILILTVYLLLFNLYFKNRRKMLPACPGVIAMPASQDDLLRSISKDIASDIAGKSTTDAEIYHEEPGNPEENKD